MATFALLHGAYHAGWHFHPLARELEARKGSRNLFLSYAPWLGQRHITLTERRTAIGFAHAIRALVDVHFSEAQTIVLVLDRLNTHLRPRGIRPFPPPKPGGC
jgi:hypothetical protein